MYKCGLAPPQGREAALAGGLRPHFFVYQDRELKFDTNIWKKNDMHTCKLTLIWTAKRPFWRAEGPHLFKTFLFIKIEDWNLVCILFLQNEIQWYAYVWVSAPQDRKTALAWGRWPHFLVYQDKKLKFGTNIWRIMIRIHVGWLFYGPQNGPFREPKPLPPS